MPISTTAPDDTSASASGRHVRQRQRGGERRVRHRRTGPRTSGPLPRRWWQRPHAIYAIASRRQIWVRVYVCAALAFAVLEAAARALIDDRGTDMTVLLALVTLVVAHVADQLLQRRVLSRHSYGWYCRTYPAHVRPDGRVACRHCGDRRVRWHRLPHRTDYRAHACVGCSATLFYGQDAG